MQIHETSHWSYSRCFSVAVRTGSLTLLSLVNVGCKVETEGPVLLDCVCKCICNHTCAHILIIKF